MGKICERSEIERLTLKCFSTHSHILIFRNHSRSIWNNYRLAFRSWREIWDFSECSQQIDRLSSDLEYERRSARGSLGSCEGLIMGTATTNSESWEDSSIFESWRIKEVIVWNIITRKWSTFVYYFSVKEAVCSATPSIFMPMFAEQMRNAWLAKSKGFARILNKFHLSETYLENHIREVMEHKAYQVNAEHFLSTFADLPMPALDEAAFKFKRLFKYNGKMPKYFYPKAIDLSYLTALNLDIWILLPLVLGFVVSK